MRQNGDRMKVILPGSYDPVTLGHLDIIKRAAEKYREVYAVVFINPAKKYMFSSDERLEMLRLATEEMDNVKVDFSDGYVIDYMREHGIGKIVKGYRNEKDLEYERGQAKWNLENGGFETELWKSREELSLVSSTEVRAILDSGTDPSSLLPKKVLEFIKNKKV